jgi:hypothetical protein
MKDLISLHVALSDSLEGGLINFRKMAQLSLIFQELQELQNATPPPGANIDLVNTLRVRASQMKTITTQYSNLMEQNEQNFTINVIS